MGSRAKGRPEKQLSDKEKELAGYMYLNGKTREQIAKRLEVSVPTLRKLLGKSLDEIKADLDAQVVGYLFSAIKNGCKASMMFYLKCQAGWKENQPEQQVEEKPAGVAAPTLTVEQWQKVREQILKG